MRRPRGRGRTRREALALMGGALAWSLAGCRSDPRPGSTLAHSLVDPDGDGLLAAGPGVPLRDRTELGGGGRPRRVLARLAQVSDVHVRDAQSPARVPFLDRLGPRLGSAFRPQEALTAQVLAATVASVNDWDEADAVLLTGDLIDSAQRNELDWALALLRGGSAKPDSGSDGYTGVQSASNPDPLYYRPLVDAPRHPGLLNRALEPVRSPGLRPPWWPVLGNHDILVQGEVAPSEAIAAVATGDRLVVAPEVGLGQFAERTRLSQSEVDKLLRGGVPGDAMRVPADARRAHLSPGEAVTRLRSEAPGRPHANRDRLNYAVGVGSDLNLIVLDLVRRDAGADGLVTESTLAFLARALADTGERHVIVACHQPLDASAGGDAVLALLDADPRVAAVLAGHTHRNAIAPRRGAAGGYWLITTASIVDFPQQWRALRLIATERGGVALETWMVDHAGQPNDEDDLAGIARDLAFLDPHGGRPARAAGPPSARNVRLHLPTRQLRQPRRRRRLPALPPPSATPATAGAGDALG
ncbi:MAG: metallophosphoesterase [Thermoleophilaceae bacterium]|nr:metallophosphoesterase [Thermoleophilaceae bacterium]